MNDDDELARALYAVAMRLARLPVDEPVDKAGLAVMHETSTLGTARPSELAARMCLDVSTISRHLHSLELQGMVARTIDPVDARAQRVSLTTRGTEVLARVLEHRAATIRAATTGWSEADSHGLCRLLRRLADDLSQVLSPCAPGATDEPARTELTAKAAARNEKTMEKL